MATYSIMPWVRPRSTIRTSGTSRIARVAQDDPPPPRGDHQPQIFQGGEQPLWRLPDQRNVDLCGITDKGKGHHLQPGDVLCKAFFQRSIRCVGS